MNISYRQIGDCAVRVGTQNASEAGDLSPLLVLNGIGTRIESLEAFNKKFRDYDLITLEVPSNPIAKGGLAGCGMQAYARLLVDVLDQLNISKVNVLGYSWGGALAQEFARRHPERCDRLVLAATSAGITMVPGKSFMSLKAINPNLLWSPKSFFKSVMQAEPKDDGKPSVDWQSMINFSPRKYIKQYLALASWSSLPWLHKIKNKTLVMHAKDDRLVSSFNAKVIAHLLSYSTLHIVNKGGHLFLYENLRGNASIIDGFFRS